MGLLISKLKPEILNPHTEYSHPKFMEPMWPAAAARNEPQFSEVLSPHEVGTITFEGETDVTGLDFEVPSTELIGGLS